jgi:hypothetical protein
MGTKKRAPQAPDVQETLLFIPERSRLQYRYGIPLIRDDWMDEDLSFEVEGQFQRPRWAQKKGRLTISSQLTLAKGT